MISLRIIEKFLDISAFKEELRKIGVAFISAGVVGIFLSHLVNFALAGWLAFLGSMLLFIGLIKRNR